MKNQISIFFIIVFVTINYSFGQTTSASDSVIDYGRNAKVGKYVEVNGIKMYYEIYGEGKPLVLLHGNGGSITNQGIRIRVFKKYFKVIAIDSRAHGKSIDTNKILTYDQMAYDIKVLLDSLHIDSTYIWGQSDGGILGLLLAIKYPAKVSKLATFGANIFPGPDALQDDIDKKLKETYKTTTNPRTKKLYSLMVDQPNITENDLKKINIPVLVMTGDRDAIKLEHSIKIFNNISKSNLFVMPGATHFGAYEKPELFNFILLDFFNKPFSKQR